MQGQLAGPEAEGSSGEGVVSSDLNGFRVGMKLEAKDRANPSLTCVATVSNIADEQILIHFDGWGTNFDYWCDPESPDIHPVGWCSRMGKTLQAPGGMF